MAIAITRLLPRAGCFDVAVAAFRGGRLQQCLSELHGVASMQGRFLGARAHLRAGHPRAALAVLPNVATATDRDRAERELLAAASHLRRGETAEASAASVAARTFAISSGDALVEAELAYYSALAAVESRDFDDARAIAESGIAALAAARTDDRAVLGRAHVIARLHEMLAVVDAGTGRYRSVIGHARQALRLLDSAPDRDVFLEAYALKNLAILGRDFALEDAEAVCTRVVDLPWTPDLALPAFTSFEAASWCAALRGDVEEALRRLRFARDAASSVPEHIFVAVDRALLCRDAGFDAMAREEVRHAATLSADYDWNRAPGDFRVALLALAQVLASSAPAEGRTCLERYRSIAGAVDVRFAGRTEDRVFAEEAYSDGIVLRAEGRTNASAERLTTAFKTWSAIGFEWRAARAALELAEMRAGDVFELAVRRELLRRPASFFAARARDVAAA